MKERDALVLNVELTLISIIQGVALYFLVESSRNLIVDRQYGSWPYIASGLVIILLFWSRSIIHGLTVIRWPLEFGHNFLYIASTLIEAVMFTQVGKPQNWFALATAYSVLIWALFVWDMGMIRRRAREDSSPAGRALFASVARDQLFNIKTVLPATFAFTAAASLAIRYFPEFFLERNGHVWLGTFQFAAGIGYLLHGLRFYKSLKPFQENYEMGQE